MFSEVLTLLFILKSYLFILILWIIFIIMTIWAVVNLFKYKDFGNNFWRKISHYFLKILILLICILCVISFFFLFTKDSYLVTGYVDINSILKKLAIVKKSLAIFIIWVLAFYLAVYVLIEYILLFVTSIRERDINNFSVLFLFTKKVKNIFLKDPSYYFILYFIQIVVILFIVELSSTLISNSEILSQVEYSVIVLMLICLYIQPFIFIFLCLKWITDIIHWIYGNLLNKEKNSVFFAFSIKKFILVTISILLAPPVMFSFIYAVIDSASSLPSSLTKMTDWKYLYYSMGISYSIPSEEIANPMNNSNFLIKFTIIIHAIAQKLFDATILGALSTLVVRGISKKS